MTKVKLDHAHARDLLRSMIRIRRFEEKCAELYGQSKIRGFLHLYVGQEAVPVGVMAALRPDERVELRARFGIAPDRPVVVYLGRLAPYQGTDLLLQAAQRVVAHTAGHAAGPA